MNLTISMLSRKMRLILWLAVFGVFELSALSCGPDFPTAVFTLQHGPDNFTAFAAGHLGVPQQRYRTRSLVITYDWTTGRALTADEQKQAVATDRHLLAQDSFTDFTASGPLPPAPLPTGFEKWLKARTVLGPVDNYVPTTDMDTFSAITGKDYFIQYPNCLDDSFATAAKTLAARSASYGAKDPAVIEWVRGQDAVFNNCPGKPSPQNYIDRNKTKPNLPFVPAATPNAPAWLKQDRDYQIAAANFYSENYDAALAGFRAMAADTSSPWSIVSRYLVARTLLRKATMGDPYLGGPADSQAKTDAAGAQLHTTLGIVQKELLTMLSEPRMAPMKHAIDSLLDYVNLRYQPDAQADVLAARLHNANSHGFGQALIDLTYIRTNNSTGTLPLSKAAVSGDKTGLLKWINTFSETGKQTALPLWQSNKSSVWLLAAMAQAKPGDAANPDLLSAAQAVPTTDPAWTTITYHRLRLMPRDAAARTALLAVMPQITKSETVSTVNLFTALNAATAPTLEDWLAASSAIPSTETSWGEEGYGLDSKPVDQACGAKLAPSQTPLFTPDSADVLNMLTPLDVLAVAAESKTLPANLHFQVTQSAWARAVMLDRPEIAHRMTPLLIACRPAWKPVLDAYDAASTPDDRKATGLLALMRFASTEPQVRGGEQRASGFATYDSFRDNWWCSIPQQVTGTDDSWVTPKPPATGPPFLTAANRTQGLSELKTLQSSGNASTYFANQALAWFKAHPADPRTADIVGGANQALRNSCRDDGTPKLAHALFDVLHQHFPQSAWTKKYKTWE